MNEQLDMNPQTFKKILLNFVWFVYFVCDLLNFVEVDFLDNPDLVFSNDASIGDSGGPHEADENSSFEMVHFRDL